MEDLSRTFSDDVKPSPLIEEYIDDPEAFKMLAMEEQIALIADLILYYAQKKTAALIEHKKTRVDSCVEAQQWYNLEKYWENQNMNLKKLVDLRVTEARRGI